MMRLILLGWLVVFTCVSANASHYEHALLSISGPGGGYGFLNERGSAFYIVETNGSYALFVDGVQRTQWFGDNLYPVPRGINDNGDIVWERQTRDLDGNPHRHVMLNDTGLSDTVPPPQAGHTWITAGAVGINESGQVGWWGRWTPGDYTLDVSHAGEVDLNSRYGLYNSEPRGLNNKGQVLWDNLETANYALPGVYVDDREVTGLILGPESYYEGAALNDNGNVVWHGGAAGWHATHVFYNRTDYTLKYAGANVESRASALNQNDQVLWGYASRDGRYHLMLDGFDVNAGVVGLHGPSAFNDHGDVVWSNAADNAHFNKVYINQYDLTADLLGDLTCDLANALDINNSGQVLWDVVRNNQTFYYLSTPVPEPSVWLLGLPLLTLALCRRNRR